VDYTIKKLLENGFSELDLNRPLSPGDKVYTVNRGKSVIAAVIGTGPITAGTNIIAAHIDAPRIDLKQNPLYDDMDIAFFKTHYYGGIKKYQWTTIPLALHGVILRADGSKLNIKIGEREDEPLFTITDLLPHLAKEQMEKKLSEGITGESLNILIGSIPGDYEKEKTKNNILKILKDKYNIENEDFVSAELEIVPAFKARDMGFDKSMIGAYGQDDRVCAYTALEAILNTHMPDRTAVVVLADKEEIGSMGNTGMMSRFFEDTMAYLCNLTNKDSTDLDLRISLGNSICLSADVGAAMDPNYKEVQEKQNAPQLNHGVLLTKYTGSRGKSSSSDASAELVNSIRRLFNQNGVLWQIGELGKVDQGGGGTVAQFLANLNIDVIDCGVPLLSMHSPFEVSAKLDVYMAYKGYKAFFEIKK
jgi:aspartyl aminopeptidase